MLDNIAFKNLSKSDYASVAEMIRQTWDFDKAASPETAVLIGNMFLRVCLSEQNFICIAKKDETPIGIIMGCAKARPVFAWRHRMALFWIIVKLKMCKEGIRIRELFNTFFSINEQLLEESGREYDGELVLFIVAKTEKKKGVGKELLNRFLEYMRTVSARDFYLFTDNYCDYEFYDQKGFRRVGMLSTDLALHPGRKMQFFMYEKEV